MRFPTLKPAEVIRVLKKAGFEELRQVGSHLSIGNKKKSVIVVVPMHNKDMKRGLLLSIIKDAGMTKDEFRKLL